MTETSGAACTARIALLRPREGDSAGNAALLAPAFAAAGYTPLALDIDSVFLDPAGLQARDDAGAAHRLCDFAHLWLLGFGQRSTTIDRFQLLASHVPAERFVNQPAAVISLHAKHALASVPAPLQLPEVRVSSNAAWLYAQLADGGEWVLKPTGGSFGRGVHLLRAGEAQARALIDSATGGDDSQYALLQRRILPGAHGELRVLLAGGTVVGTYRRTAAPATFASNLAQHGQASAVLAGAEVVDACAALGRQLAAAGIGFAGLDLAWPWVIEVNVANPGGLATLQTLGDAGAAQRLVAALSDAWARCA